MQTVDVAFHGFSSPHITSALYLHDGLQPDFAFADVIQGLLERSLKLKQYRAMTSLRENASSAFPMPTAHCIEPEECWLDTERPHLWNCEKQDNRNAYAVKYTYMSL